MSRRSRRTAGGLVASVLVLGGCAPAVVEGEGVPDWAEVEASGDARFDAQLELLAQSIIASDPFVSDVETDVAGVAYTHATYREHTLDSQSVVAMYGSPPVVFWQQSDAEPGATVDELHLAGDQYDYVLLGDTFASVAPTSWVRLPTDFDGVSRGDLGGLCEVSGFYHACFLYDMIVFTAESDRGDDVRRLVSVDEDGTVHSQTEVTLESLLESRQVLVFSDDIVAEFTDEMRQSLIPVHFWQDAEGNLLKMEMNGVFPGSDGAGDLVIQTGFEITGLGSDMEFPSLPPEWDITTIEGDEQVQAFWDDVWELK